MNDFDATEITWETLVGHSGERPQEWGNCFGMKSADNRNFTIVNFNLENLEALIELGLSFPIKCRAIGERHAVVHDPRIGERWYQKAYCTICTPMVLLQPFQLQQQDREIMRGQRTEQTIEVDGKKLTVIRHNFEKQPEFK